jgi:hypothetical protein
LQATILGVFNHPFGSMGVVEPPIGAQGVVKTTPSFFSFFFEKK